MLPKGHVEGRVEVEWLEKKRPGDIDRIITKSDVDVMRDKCH
jgi:hypothetical protein